MAKTIVRDHESFDETLRRFKRNVSRSGTLAEARRRKYYVKPSVSKKLKKNKRNKR